MPFSNYAELQELIEKYLEQEDVSGMVPDFIRLAEVRFRREIRNTRMVATDKGDMNGDTIPFPPGFLEALEWRTDDGQFPTVMEYVPPKRFYQLNASKRLGRPSAYTVVGTSIVVAPDPGTWDTDPNSGETAFYTYAVDYYKELSELTSTNGSNWLLTFAPDLYLYGSLLEAEPYLVNDARMATWEKLYERGRNSLTAADARSRYRPGGVMRPESIARDGKNWGRRW